MFFLPDVGCGTHEDVVEQKETSLLRFDDLAAVAVDGLDHVVRADQVAAAVTQKLMEHTDASLANKAKAREEMLAMPQPAKSGHIII